MSPTSAIVIDSILDGEMDTELDQVIAAAKERREQLANRLRFQLRAGDRIRIVGDPRPTYLRGLTARVIRVNQTTVTCEFENPDAARRYRHGIRLHLEYAEKVEG